MTLSTRSIRPKSLHNPSSALWHMPSSRLRSGLDLQHEHAVADDVDYRGLAQLAIRHGLAVRVDVAMHQQPRLQLGDHLVQAPETMVRLVLTVAAISRGRLRAPQPVPHGGREPPRH
jgi:hypothetical protein